MSRRIGRGVWTTPRIVVLVGVLAAAFRLPALLFQLSPDEAGFLLVARNWSPSPISVYGPYFVDRPPELIALIRLSDAVGGPFFLRVLGGVATFVLVVAVARVGWLIAGDLGARWSALVAGSFGSTMMLQSVHTKGEILGVAVVALSLVATLEALRHDGVRGLLLAASAGLCASAALGLKQNLLGGLVFGGFLLLGSALARRIGWRRFWAYAAAALPGAAVPVLATIAWARLAGVDLERVWYVTFGFRGIANRVITATSVAAPAERARLLVLIAVATGMVALLLLAVLRLRQVWRIDRVLLCATLAMFLVDLVGLVLGGSYWPPYLINPIPGLAVLTALLAAARNVREVTAPDPAPDAAVDTGGRRRALRWRGPDAAAVGFTVASTVVTLIAGLLWFGALGNQVPTDRLGEAIRASSRPDDTITVYGGRAEIVLESGLDAPYPYLWSLPMRVQDPELIGLRALLAGPRRPTWFVLAVPLGAWGIEGGGDIRRLLTTFYRPLGSACGKPVFLATTAVRPPLRCGQASSDARGTSAARHETRLSKPRG